MGVPRPDRRLGPLNPIRTGGAPTQDEPEPTRHDQKCPVCNHPYREAIEEDFINWMRTDFIAREFDLTQRGILRHARATGLCELRGRKLLSAADFLIECASEATVTGDTVLRAIRTRTRLTADGEWVEQPKRVIYTVEHVSSLAAAPSASHLAPPKALSLPNGSEVRVMHPEPSGGAEGAVPNDNGLRQRTALAVPNDSEKSGVLTPEVGGNHGHDSLETSSQQGAADPILIVSQDPLENDASH